MQISAAISVQMTPALARHRVPVGLVQVVLGSDRRRFGAFDVADGFRAGVLDGCLRRDGRVGVTPAAKTRLVRSALLLIPRRLRSSRRGKAFATGPIAGTGCAARRLHALARRFLVRLLRPAARFGRRTVFVPRRRAGNVDHDGHVLDGHRSGDAPAARRRRHRFRPVRLANAAGVFGGGAGRLLRVYHLAGNVPERGGGGGAGRPGRGRPIDGLVIRPRRLRSQELAYAALAAAHVPRVRNVHGFLVGGGASPRRLRRARVLLLLLDGLRIRVADALLVVRVAARGAHIKSCMTASLLLLLPYTVIFC